jgi:hypothetical protein
MIHNLFPTPVGMYKLERDLTEKELDFIKGQETRPNMGNVTSKDNTILRNKDLTKLRDFIETSVADYFKTIHNPKHNVSLTSYTVVVRTTQSLVSSITNTHTLIRLCQESFILKPTEKPTRFTSTVTATSMVKLPPEEWNVWNSESLGGLKLAQVIWFLFPSSLTHMVETVQGEADKD